MSKKNVYGENLPAQEGKKVKGIREEKAKDAPEDGVAEQMDKTREKEIKKKPTGGMGRSDTPKDSKKPGSFGHDKE